MKTDDYGVCKICRVVEICEWCDDHERRVCVFCMDPEHRRLWEARVKELNHKLVNADSY